MIAPQKKPFRHIWATGPLGNRARFDCLGDVPFGWAVDGQEKHPIQAIEDMPADAPIENAPPKRKPGRPPKVRDEHAAS